MLGVPQAGLAGSERGTTPHGVHAVGMQSGDMSYGVGLNGDGPQHETTAKLVLRSRHVPVSAVPTAWLLQSALCLERMRAHLVIALHSSVLVGTFF